MTYEDLKSKKEEWKMSFGASTAIEIHGHDIIAIIPKLIEGLDNIDTKTRISLEPKRSVSKIEIAIVLTLPDSSGSVTSNRLIAHKLRSSPTTCSLKLLPASPLIWRQISRT